jgi:Cd2+/Zn2+-exporting ATPase
MEATIRKEYSLEGLCCPVCAEKIQQGVGKLEGVDSVVVDFSTQRLFLTLRGGLKRDGMMDEVGRIVRQYEPGIVVRETGAREPARTEETSDTSAVVNYVRLGLGAALFIVGMASNFGGIWELALFMAAYLLVGIDVLWNALKNIVKGQVFDENFLMGIATVGAFAIGEYPEGVAVMLFFRIGEMFEHIAVGRSRRSISALMDVRPDFANLKQGNEWKQVPAEDVAVGEHILVRPGERIPLDGIVTEGFSALDVSALTGEMLPRDVSPGSEVLSGSVNKNGMLSIRVVKAFSESTASKILELVQNASLRKSKAENFITKFARFYTPAVVFAAVLLALLPPLLLPEARFSDWLARALVFLVVSCPCALVISIPLSFFGGIGGASRNGVLIKGGNYLEALHNVDAVVFDKTGTLTKGLLTVTNVVPSEGVSADELLRLAACAESVSSHPIAASVIRAYGKAVGTPDEVEEIAGCGVKARLDGRTVLVGNGRLLADVEFPRAETVGTTVHVALDGRYVGHIVIDDVVKADSRQAIAALRAVGVREVAMLTGDSQAVGERVAAELGLDRVFAELLPHQKVEKLEELERAKITRGKLVFVGDGINDAPVLARADIGVAMGGVGSDAAIEAADVVLMTDEPSKVAVAIRIARKTRAIVWQNVIFALGVKGVILALGAMGMVTMWAAVFGDVGVAVIAILNAMRAMRVLPEAV